MTMTNEAGRAFVAQLPTVEQVPLHATTSPLPAAMWFGCEHPERPPDDRTAWDPRCRACALHAWTALCSGGPDAPGAMISIDANAPKRSTGFEVIDGDVAREEIRAALAELHGVTV